MSLLPGRTRGVQEQPNPTQRRERSSNAAPSFPFHSGGSSSSTFDVNDSNLHPSVFVNRAVANSLRVPYNGSSSISPASSLIFNSSGEEIPPLDSSNSFQLLSSSPPNSSISLTLPRPDHQRSNNLYVDTPFPHRPTPRREESSHNSPHNSTFNVRSASPATRTVSPSSLSVNFSQNSSLNSSPPHPNTSILPSVHGTHAQRSFINPNCRNVNNINSSTNCHNVKNSSSSNNRINKLSSSSFSFSSSKNRGGGLVIQNQSTTPLNFIKNNHFGGSGGVGGKSFSKPKQHSNSKKDLSKSVGDLRADDRRVSGNFLGISNLIGTAGSGDSIICSHCGKCRCEACTTPKPPPSAWICNGKCLCSPAGIVDCLSCACCVKGLLYHCRRGEEGSHRPRENLNRRQNTIVTIHDDDASSTATKDIPSYAIGSRCALWSCLVLAAVPLPCLLCYFPLTALRKFMEKCYQRCTYHGCRCSAYPPPPPSSVITSQPSSVSTTPLATPPTRPHLLARPLDTRLLQEPSFAPPSPPSLLL